MDALTSPEGRCPAASYQDIASRDGPVPEPLSLTSNPPQPVDPVPFDRYISREFFDLEMKRMWPRVWQYACREEHLREEGDFHVYDIGRYSFVLVRGDDGDIRAYYNSCLHRGTKLKPSGSSGWSASLTCPYHAWEWNLDGSVKNIPCPWDFPHIDRDKTALPQARVECWNGFVFINMDDNAPPLSEYLEVMPDHFRNWDLTGWYVSQHVQKELAGNWKLAQDAFMEAYHTPYVHPEMTHVVSDQNMQHDIFGAHVTRDLCAMASPSPTSTRNMSEQDLLDSMLQGDPALKQAAPVVPDGRTARWVMAEQLRATMAEHYDKDYSGHSVPEMIDSIKYTVFPNLFIYPAPGLALIQTFRPLGHDQDRALFDQMVLKPKPVDGSDWDVAEPVRISEDESYATVPGFDPFLASVLDQDTQIMRWQREGMYASHSGGQNLARYQEARIRRVHETLDTYIAMGDINA